MKGNTMSSRSYDIDVHIDSEKVGFMLYCFEGDDCIFEQFFKDMSKAKKLGEKFLDGYFYSGFPIYLEEELVS